VCVMCACVCMYLCVCACVCVYLCVCVCMCLCVSVCMWYSDGFVLLRMLLELDTGRCDSEDIGLPKGVVVRSYVG